LQGWAHGATGNFFSSKIFFYILSWTILKLSKKENPDLSQNWPQEKLSKLTGRKSVLKTCFWAFQRY
jgi:hypothetical protein